jgi:hypothetical protein
MGLKRFGAVATLCQCSVDVLSRSSLSLLNAFQTRK